jgi:hypothetical protein
VDAAINKGGPKLGTDSLYDIRDLAVAGNV